MADALTADTLAASNAAQLAVDLAAVQADVADVSAQTIVAIDDTDSPYTPATADDIILVDATAESVTVDLPAAASASGRVLHIKRLDDSANTVTVDPDGAETIDGATTASITVQYENLTVASTGTNWVIL